MTGHADALSTAYVVQNIGKVAANMGDRQRQALHAANFSKNNARPAGGKLRLRNPALAAKDVVVSLGFRGTRETRKNAHEQERLDWFGEVLLEPGVERALRVFRAGVGGERHCGRAGAVGAQRSDE